MRKLAAGLVLLVLPLIAQSEVFKARLEWAHTVEMRFIEDGVVNQVPVLLGQVVKSGDVLAELDSREFELAEAEAAARVSSAEAVLAKADRQLQWTTELYDRGLISDNERLEAEERAASARAEHELAKAGLGRARIALERTVMKAPFDSIVAAVSTWPGQSIVKQLQRDPLVLLADGRRMVARARLTADRIDDFRMGDPVEVRVEGGGWRPGRVYRMGVESEDIIDRGAVYALDAMFEINPEEGLRPGQTAAVRVDR